MSRGQRAVCDWCYHMFLMAPNARLRLCPECKAEYRKMKKKEAARKKREAQHKRYYEKLRKKPAYTIGEVLRMAQEAQVSYGEMVERLGKE